MKLSIKSLKKMIREAIYLSPKDDFDNMKVAILHMSENGRIWEFDGQFYNIFDIACERNPQLEIDLDNDCEEAFYEGVAKIEDEFLRQHNITHVIDYEGFNDKLPHPVEEYMQMNDDLFKFTGHSFDEN